MAMEISATLDLRFWGLITVQYTDGRGTVIVEHVEIRCGEECMNGQGLGHSHRTGPRGDSCGMN